MGGDYTRGAVLSRETEIVMRSAYSRTRKDPDLRAVWYENKVTRWVGPSTVLATTLTLGCTELENGDKTEKHRGECYTLFEHSDFSLKLP